MDPEWPRVKSSYHRNRCCDPCFICGSRQPRYDHFGALSCGEQRFIRQHFGRDIPGVGCMCRAHHKEAQRHKCNPEHVPTWKKNKRLQHMTENIHCMFPNCNITSLHNKIIVPSAEMQPQFSEVLNTLQFVQHTTSTYTDRYTVKVHVLGVGQSLNLDNLHILGTAQMLLLSLST